LAKAQSEVTVRVGTLNIRIKYNKCSMFGIRDEISSGIGRTMKPERSDGSDLRWKRSETKADEPRGQKVLAGRKQAERRSTRRHCAEIRRIKGSDSAYFGRFNNRTVVYHIFNSVKVTIYGADEQSYCGKSVPLKCPSSIV
jgi:hypothetical protein